MSAPAVNSRDWAIQTVQRMHQLYIDLTDYLLETTEGGVFEDEPEVDDARGAVYEQAEALFRYFGLTRLEVYGPSPEELAAAEGDQ